jgi:hypothetical protein
MTKKAFFAGARSFIQANRMHELFNATDSDVDIRDFNHYFTTPQGIYFALWYALLYNVLEFLREQRSLPKPIAADVQTIFHPLRRFRNVIFHTPPKYFDERFNVILNKKAFDTILRIHFELSAFFDAELKKYGEYTELTP